MLMSNSVRNVIVWILYPDCFWAYKLSIFLVFIDFVHSFGRLNLFLSNFMRSSVCLAKHIVSRQVTLENGSIFHSNNLYYWLKLSIVFIAEHWPVHTIVEFPWLGDISINIYFILVVFLGTFFECTILKYLLINFFTEVSHLFIIGPQRFFVLAFI